MAEAPRLAVKRLRSRREEENVSIRVLAERVGVSPSLVSQIETGKVNPSVGTLVAIATELELSLDELFADSEPTRPSSQVAASTPLILRSDQRPALELDTGVTWYRLTPGPESDVDFLYVVYEVGGASCPVDGMMAHRGREYGLVLAGRLGATVGFDHYELGAGDSIVFEATTPHRFWTIGETPATVVWTIIGRGGDRRADFLD